MELNPAPKNAGGCRRVPVASISLSHPLPVESGGRSNPSIKGSGWAGWEPYVRWAETANIHRRERKQRINNNSPQDTASPRS